MIDHNRKEAREDIDHIFKDLLPIQGMPERPEQIALSHRMLEAMQGGGIALCDAGTGIGKTYAYLVAGVVFHGLRPSRPILISTSSIALQKAVRDEYLPFLSTVLIADGMIAEPIQAVIRKGKSHYVCDQRLERRLGQLDLRKKNWRAGNALLFLREKLDMDEAPRLSSYDREQVCVPKVCDCGREDCRYRTFLDSCDGGQYPFQICNHNLLLADAIHRGTGRQPILPDSLAIIIDEAHKLPETARHMFGVTLRAEDIQGLIHDLRREKYLLAADALADTSRLFLRKLERPRNPDRRFSEYARLLVAPNRALTVVQKQVNPLLSPSTRRRLEKLASTVALFSEGHPDMVFYLAEDARDTVMLCATVADLTAQLQSTLWSQPRPIVLTSGTLAVGSDFRRFREEAGLLEDSRVTESVSLSPFDYRENCLLYAPQFPSGQKNEMYYDKLANEIALLLDAACGHALVLFTSYAAMSAVKERLSEKDLVWPLFTLGRNAVHTTEQFKASPGSVLLATGAAWEGFDFPGDCVSLLVIPRLPFARPDALKEKERESFPNLHSFIRDIVVPEMQIKLKQGFGRAIRTETDTCVVAILDERSVPGQRYFEDVKAVLPDMRITDSLQEVEAFIRSVKGPDYFREGGKP
ncbi:ATP-dependent DNA helicase [Oscillibacter sp.]|jgi:ATP-dependent DNA helicase DinG|uniref:ATP-dependent DNA helicase n=1 Tax=Oscillibacter sp. TaxID=1945593 RepID=UPI0021735891|nr:ATP-dependent DNA helicase [Oscillibacter sp.]MCI9648142.1 ATP-dependent DNA helicase [Oscillibacter sp.]